MKKTIIVIGAIVFAAIVLFFCLYFALTAPKFAGDFSVGTYQEEIENDNFQTQLNYGKIDDYTSAASAGKKALADRFENSDGGIFEWMGCSVQYDAETDAYYIRTYHINPNVLGGTYDVIIRSDGKVLAIWGEK
ncbi:MAG: hypothetical protein IJF42_00240 [Clostridia bacterium]|nr:hypothetical protein [Clostridia bacterium]